MVECFDCLMFGLLERKGVVKVMKFQQQYFGTRSSKNEVHFYQNWRMTTKIWLYFSIIWLQSSDNAKYPDWLWMQNDWEVPSWSAQDNWQHGSFFSIVAESSIVLKTSPARTKEWQEKMSKHEVWEKWGVVYSKLHAISWSRGGKSKFIIIFPVWQWTAGRWESQLLSCILVRMKFTCQHWRSPLLQVRGCRSLIHLQREGKKWDNQK